MTMNDNRVSISDGDVLAGNDKYRVRVVSDAYGGFDMKPDGDAYVPQVTYDTGTALNMQHKLGRVYRDALRDFGVTDYLLNGVPTERVGTNVIAKFERWARVFHGVNARVFRTVGYSQGDEDFIIAWPDAEWRALVGVSDDYVPNESDVHDLSAWIWGDVYYLKAERLTRWESDAGDVVETWDEVDAWHGYYHRVGDGGAHLIDEAQALLGCVTDDDA